MVSLAARALSVWLALASTAVLSDDVSEASCYDTGDKGFYGSCGILMDESNEWCTFEGKRRCFAKNQAACCDVDIVRVILLIVTLSIVFMFATLVSCAICGWCPFYDRLFCAPKGGFCPHKSLDDDEDDDDEEDYEYAISRQDSASVRGDEDEQESAPTMTSRRETREQDQMTEDPFLGSESGLDAETADGQELPVYPPDSPDVRTL